MDDVTIFKGRLKTGMQYRVYYYFGNFYSPLSGIPLQDKSRINRLIQNFMQDNKSMIERDRAHPDYKTLVELFDEQMVNENEN